MSRETNKVFLKGDVKSFIYALVIQFFFLSRNSSVYICTLRNSCHILENVCSLFARLQVPPNIVACFLASFGIQPDKLEKAYRQVNYNKEVPGGVVGGITRNSNLFAPEMTDFYTQWLSLKKKKNSANGKRFLINSFLTNNRQEHSSSVIITTLAFYIWVRV